MVTVSSSGGAALSGVVDSSLVSTLGTNAVYVYSGVVTPDDIGGSGANPLATALVSRDEGACTWRYAFTTLAPGQYTVAFTNQAASDDAQRDDTISFTGTATVNIAAGGLVRDFAPARVLRVGPGRSYTTLRQVAAAAQSGDVIEIDAGVYTDDIVVWRQNNLTLRGVGAGRAHMRATREIPYIPGNDQQNGMGIWVARGNNTKVENIEFSGAAVPDRNGAGIRAEGPNLSVCNAYFHDNENGILGGSGDVVVDYSEFSLNGGCEPGYGCSHNMYILPGTNRFYLRHSYSHHARIGHNVKSRARENYILYNRIMDESDGTSSYAIDLPNGGLSYLIGNLVQQGPLTENAAMIAYGVEGLSNPSRTLYAVNNTLVNDRGSGTFLLLQSGSTATVMNNMFVGNGTTIRGAATAVTNLSTNTPNFVNRGAYDYRLTISSPGLNAGTAPGSGDGFDLTPLYQYVHNAGREPRARNDAIDIGAYEYVP
jgi:hypothetical protein